MPRAAGTRVGPEPSSSAQPGSSKIPQMARSKQSGNQKQPPVAAQPIDVTSDEEEDQLMDDNEAEEEEVVEIAAPAKPAPKPRPRPKTTQADPSSSSSKVSSNTNAKGKAAAPEPAPSAAPAPRKSALKTSSKPPPPEEDDIEEEEEEEAPPPRAVRPAAAPSSRASTGTLERELERLRRQLEVKDAQIAKYMEISEGYKQRFEDLLRAQEPPPDEALQRRNEELERRVQLLKEQVADLTKVGQELHLFGSGAGTVHFMTREAAQKERKGVEKELSRAKKLVKEEQDRVAEKNNEITELKEDLRIRNAELKAEIERTKSGVQPRGVPSSLLSEANRATVQLYEDLMNIMVLDVKFERSIYFDLTERIFKCLCSRSKVDEESEPSHAVTFFLRIYWEPRDSHLPQEQRTPVTSKEQLFEQCKYVPIDLDKETDEEFLANLDFLTEPFTFAKHQLDVFAKTLAERISGQQNNSNEESFEAATEADRTEYMTEADDQSVMEIENPEKD